MKKTYLLLFIFFCFGCTEEIALALKEHTFSNGLSTLRYLGQKEARLATSEESLDANEILEDGGRGVYADLNEEY